MPSPAVSRRAILRAKYRGIFRSIISRPTTQQSSRHGARIIGSVVHTTESSNSSFEAIIRFFQNKGTPASAHYVVDALPLPGRRYVRVVQLVPETSKAWTALSANPYFVQYELIGFAHRSRVEWLGPYRAQLETLAALVADDALQYGFPARHAVPGVVGHVDLPRWGFPQTHTDPGRNFPWDVFLRMVNEALVLATPKPPNQPVSVKRARRRVAAHT